ncbi:MAG: hypothetical protein P8Z76_20720 [Alphaproteobacteria bacterium]
MPKKSESGKTQTRKQPAQRNKAPESHGQHPALSDIGGAVDAARRHADAVQTHTTDALKTTVQDIQKRQKKLRDDVAAIAKKTTLSAEAKVEATQKALDDFDAFLTRVASGIDRQRAALGEQASALRKQLDSLKTDAVTRTEKDYAKAEKAVKDFDKFVAKTATSLEKDVVSFVDRAELQLKSMGETIALYGAKSAEMARDGSRGVADLWKDLKHSQKNARKQINAFSKSSTRAWKDIAKGLDRAWSELAKARKKAASRYAGAANRSAAKRVASGKAKPVAKGSKPAAKKPAKAATKTRPSTGPAASSVRKAPPAKKPATSRSSSSSLANPTKS